MELKNKPIDLIKLKVKTKSLAEEAKIIRKEEKKALSAHKRYHTSDNCTHFDFLEKSYCLQYHILREHRVIDVRREARATHLAIAFIKGIDYNVVESKVHDKHIRDLLILPRVVNMVLKYGYKRDPRYAKPEEKQAVSDRISEWFGD